jgi:hypothetical protein
VEFNESVKLLGDYSHLCETENSFVNLLYLELPEFERDYEDGCKNFELCVFDNVLDDCVMEKSKWWL